MLYFAAVFVICVISSAPVKAQLSTSIDLTATRMRFPNVQQDSFLWSRVPMPSTEPATGGWTTIGNCGCWFAGLATMAGTYLEDAALQLPKFATTGNGGIPLILGWNPAYFNHYFTYGPPGLGYQPMWGYKEVGDCGVRVSPWAMRTFAVPSPPFTVFGATGLTPRWHPQPNGLTQEGRRMIDERLSLGEPTLVSRRNFDDAGKDTKRAHLQIVAGWDASRKRYLVLDPLFDQATVNALNEDENGNPLYLRLVVPFGWDSKYESWEEQIDWIIMIEPAYAAGTTLFIEDDPSPISFAVTDPAGRRSGFNPLTDRDEHNSPNAFQWEQQDDTPTIGGSTRPGSLTRGLQVFDPFEGVWRFEVIGTAEGPYTFTVGTTSGTEKTILRTVNGDIAAGQVIKQEMVYKPGSPAVVTTVSNFTPQSIVGGDLTATPRQSLTFDGSRSFDADGSVVSWNWDFGDGNQGSGAKLTHAYQSAGDFTATLRVTDNQGSTHSASSVVRVRDLTPVAEISGPYIAIGSRPVQFRAGKSFDPRGGTLTATWDFGDGTPPLVTTNLAPAYQFKAGPSNKLSDVGDKPIVFTVTLLLSNGVEQSSPVTTTVTRLPLPLWETGTGVVEQRTFNRTACFNPGEKYIITGVAPPRLGSSWLRDRVASWNLADGPLPRGQFPWISLGNSTFPPAHRGSSTRTLPITSFAWSSRCHPTQLLGS